VRATQRPTKKYHPTNARNSQPSATAWITRTAPKLHLRMQHRSNGEAGTRDGQRAQVRGGMQTSIGTTHYRYRQTPAEFGDDYHQPRRQVLLQRFNEKGSLRDFASCCSQTRPSPLNKERIHSPGTCGLASMGPGEAAYRRSVGVAKRGRAAMTIIVLMRRTNHTTPVWPHRHGTT
jgi:hypothetical protein